MKPKPHRKLVYISLNKAVEILNYDGPIFHSYPVGRQTIHEKMTSLIQTGRI